MAGTKHNQTIALPHLLKSLKENETLTSKYIIYKGSGGLVHMLTGLQCAIKIAINENRILIIDTLKHSCFRANISDYFILKEKQIIIQENYNDIINDEYKGLKIEIIKNGGTRCTKGGYILHDLNISKTPLNSEEKILIYAGVGQPGRFPNLKLKDAIISDIIHKYKGHDINYIAIHYRNTDIKNNIDNFINKILSSNCGDKVNSIFIATDDFNAFDIFKTRLPEYNVFRILCPMNFNGQNLHYHVKDKKELVMNTLYDIYMILNSKYFIPSMNSGLSTWCIDMIKKNDNIFNIKTHCEIM